MTPAFTAVNLLAWSIQVAVIVLAGGVGIHLARLRSPRVRLACFRALLVTCLALPFVQPAVSALPAGTSARTGGQGTTAVDSRGAGSERQLAATSVEVTPETAPPASAASSDGRLPGLPEWAVTTALVVLGIGMAARLAWLLAGLVGLSRLRRQAACGVHAGAAPTAVARAIDLAGADAEIRTSPAVKHPVTFGLRRPVVLLPESFGTLDESEQVAVVCHELLHVRRRDWLQTVGEEILRAVLWFHPAVWWLLAHVDLSREQLVDQEVVALTERRQPYLNALVTLALARVGPVLRPASLFLGRAHLVQRVALLSMEVRMSRPRLVLSLAVVTAALIAGGQFVVHAFPLEAVAVSPVSTSTTVLPAPPLPATPLKGATALAAPPTASAEVPLPPPQDRTYAEVLQRVEPIVSAQPPQPAADTIVALQATIQPSGAVNVNGPAEMIVGLQGKRVLEMKAADADLLQRMLAQDMAGLRSGTPYVVDAGRAAVDALRSWQFAPAEKPFTTVVGFNFARGEQSGAETVPVRIGGDIPAPARIRNVAPIYPQEAQQKGIQGVVITQLVIDGAGIPISAYVLRPVDGLSMAAVQAALQWRYQPDATYSRRLMTVTANFTLTGGVPPPLPPPPGVTGGVEGGVSGGVAGGVAGGVTGATRIGRILGVDSFGAPQSRWPSNAVRIGGEIKAPTRIVNVNPVYPADAVAAKIQGVVIVEVLIGEDGSVQAGQILRSIPMLDQAALDAVRQWRYVPALLNGNPVPVIMTVTANFTLQ